MKNILLIGAGRSASYLIKYLLDNSFSSKMEKFTVGDVSVELAKQKIKNNSNARAIAFDVNDDSQRESEIKKSDIVISMLPAYMQLSCREGLRAPEKKIWLLLPMFSKEIKELDSEAKKNGVLLLNEIGLDPGIDHLSRNEKSLMK